MKKKTIGICLNCIDYGTSNWLSASQSRVTQKSQDGDKPYVAVIAWVMVISSGKQ